MNDDAASQLRTTSLLARSLPSQTLACHVDLKTMLPASRRARMSLLAKTSQELEAHFAHVGTKEFPFMTVE
jgi:hypothetical protein